MLAVVRFVNEWSTEQRLVHLEFLLKSVTGEEIARELLSIISVTLGVESHMLLGVMHDRASVNSAAMRIVRGMYPRVLDIGCISHTLDLVGSKCKCPSLHIFFTLWISFFHIFLKVGPYGKKKQVERCHLIPKLGGGVDGRSCIRFSNSLDKLRDIIRDPQQLIALKMELAAVICWYLFRERYLQLGGRWCVGGKLL